MSCLVLVPRALAGRAEMVMGWGGGILFVDHTFWELILISLIPPARSELSSLLYTSINHKRHSTQRTESVERCHSWAKTSGVILQFDSEKSS